jgi:putative tryptophan/tyrosine transport system substrate-binding protein
MKRREFITLLSGAAVAWPVVARAQQSTQPRAALLWVATERVVKPYEESMRAGFRDLGYIEGRNLILDVRYANGDVPRLPMLVDDLIALKPDVLLGNNQVAALMKAKTATIPIVLNWSYDPVEIGLVESLSRPGGNVTGMATMYEDLLTKHVELAGELVSGMSRIGFINDASDPSAERFNGIAEKAARAKSVALTLMPVRDRESVEAAFAKFGTDRPDVLIVGLTGGLFNLRDPIAEGSRKFNIPVIYSFEGFVKAGGLLSYAPDYHATFRRSISFVDKIFKGAKPADLPIEQPTKFALVINLKAAKTLGLEIPPLLLARADEVIE